MHYGTLFISKVIDTKDVKAFARFGIDEADFPSKGEREAYRYVVDYAEKNRGDTPDYATIALECENFDYIPGVEAAYEFMSKEIKTHRTKLAISELFFNGDNSKALQLIEKHKNNGTDLIDSLLSEMQRIKMETNVREKVGTNVKTDGEKFMGEYNLRKSGESLRLWKSKFPFINDTVGGYMSSNVYTVYGKSGRGKSVITLEEALECACQGANVLIWAMEMGWFEVLVRIYVSLSARQGVTTASIDGLDMSAGFDSSALRYGKLNEEFEREFNAFLAGLNEQIPGNIIVRAVDDDDFDSRTLRALEADILATKADVVVIDPFYYLDYETNTSKTTGGDAAETSKKLRRLAGRTRTVMFAITQAEEGKQEENDDGSRMLDLPDRAAVKKTKQLLEDAYLLIAVDTDYLQGRGLIGLNKGRDGGEGIVGEITYIPQVGIVKELTTGNVIADKFGM